MKKQQVKTQLSFKRTSIVNLTNIDLVKGGFAKPTGDSCFEVCNTDVRNCTWGNE